MNRFQNSNVSIIMVTIKYCIGKSVFVVSLQLKNRSTVTHSNTRSPKLLHALLETYFYHVLAKVEPNRWVRNANNTKLLDKKTKQNKTTQHNNTKQKQKTKTKTRKK